MTARPSDLDHGASALSDYERKEALHVLIAAVRCDLEANGPSDVDVTDYEIGWVLQIAAPLIAAQALRDAAKEIPWRVPPTSALTTDEKGNYRASDWLRERADAMTRQPSP